MNRFTKILRRLLPGLIAGLGSVAAYASPAEPRYLDITPFGTVCRWSSPDSPLGEEAGESSACNLGIRWWDARDIRHIEVTCRNRATEATAAALKVEYWHDTWPDNPPEMPSYEDEEDDPWRGEWVQAAADATLHGNKITYTFRPLGREELLTADRLPGAVTYRRTLKIRVTFPEQYRDEIRDIAAFAMAELQDEQFRIEFLPGEKPAQRLSGRIEVFNGRLEGLSGWNWRSGDRKTAPEAWSMAARSGGKGVVVRVSTARPLLPGSNEETVVTVRTSGGTFSFATADVADGPLYIPAFNAYVTYADDPAPFSESVVKGSSIREQTAAEPEQSYARASREIPAKDPTWDQSGRRIYLPLACDANWQKFAVEWGGNLIIDRLRANVRGKALGMCTWNGDAINWNIGTGESPCYARTPENCRMSVLNDHLPVVSAGWNHEGLLFEEEAFVTFTGNAPLAPSDPARDEFTPAVLLVKLRVTNPSLKPRQAHVWLQGNDALTELSLENGFIYDRADGKKLLRGHICGPRPGLPEPAVAGHGLHYTVELEANASETFEFRFPFIGNLTPSDEQLFTALDYAAERERVVGYWRDAVRKSTVFSVPDAAFNNLARAVVPHIRMSVMRDPESGLYLVPAASFNYPVYANESIFQTVLLDRLGDAATVKDYLETFLRLQGSRKLPGDYTGDQREVFHGVKISESNDYTALGYNMNHGTVLWGLAHYYMLSKDGAWLERAAPQLMKAADWIVSQRQRTRITGSDGQPVPHYGLLPAGMLEDCREWRYWYATNAYSYLGLRSVAEAFREAGRPEAAHYAQEAEAYRRDILNSLQRAMELSPVVRLRNNTCVPYVPVRPYQRFRYFGSKKSAYYDRYGKGIRPTLRLSSTREVLYGPVTLLKTGLVDARSEMAEWILDDWEDNLTLSTSLNLNTHGWVDDEYWFSRGGMVFQAALQNPISVYLDRHETKSAIRSLYNNFSALFYPDVIALTEEYRMWKHASGPLYKTPDEARMVGQIIDLLLDEKEGEIRLANGVPQRWLEPGQQVVLRGLRTRYGAFSYTLTHGAAPETVEAVVSQPEEAPCVLLFVHAPFGKPIRSVSVNGQPWSDWDADRQAVRLPRGVPELRVVVDYRD